MRIINRLIVATMIVACIVTASGFDFGASQLSAQQEALLLEKMKVLKGNGESFALDQRLTRAEAATFIVKLMGQEETILKNKADYSTVPFTDVQEEEWFAPFVGYCYEHDIVNGYNPHTFGPNDPLSEKAFLTMVLKAMQYTDEDFSWTTVNQMAYDVGLVDDIAYAVKVEDNTTYFREDVVHVLYRALGMNRKNTSKKVVEYLVDNDVIQSSLPLSLGLMTVDKVQSKIDQIAVEDNQKVIVRLNEAVKELQKGQVSIESSTGTVSISELIHKDNEVILQTQNMAPGTVYQLTIRTIEDKVGNVTPKLTEEFETEAQIEVESSYFRIRRAEVVDRRRMNVYFTHPVTEESTLSLYYDILENNQPFISGSYKSIKVLYSDKYPDRVSIVLKENAFNEDQTYTVAVKGDLLSKYGSRLHQGVADRFDMIGRGNEPERLAVTSIKQIDDERLLVTFNQQVENTSAMENANYAIKAEGGRAMAIASSVELMDNRTEAVVTFRSLEDDEQYKMTVDNIKDFTEYSQVDDYLHEFVAVDGLREELELEHAYALNKGEVWLYFNQPISDTSRLAVCYVDGERRFAAMRVSDENPNVLIGYVKKDRLLSSHKYDLVLLTGIYDAYGRVWTERLTYEMDGSSQKKMLPTLKETKRVDDNKIMLSFKNPISLEESTDSSQYKVEFLEEGKINQIHPSQVTGVDAYTVILSFDELDTETSYELYGKELEDYSEQYTFSFDTVIQSQQK